MTTLIEVVGDFVCPWCFIGERRLKQALAGSHRPERYSIRWLPFELDPAMPAEGRERSSYRTQRFGSLERSMQMDQRATLAGREVGIEFRYDLITRVPNTTKAHLLAWRLGTNGAQAAAVDAIFRAYFLDGRDIGSTQTLLEIAQELGQPTEAVTALFDDPAPLQELRKLERQVASRGVATVPSHILNRGELVQGLDSLISTIRQESHHAA